MSFVVLALVLGLLVLRIEDGVLRICRRRSRAMADTYSGKVRGVVQMYL